MNTIMGTSAAATTEQGGTAVIWIVLICAVIAAVVAGILWAKHRTRNTRIETPTWSNVPKPDRSSGPKLDISSNDRELLNLVSILAEIYKKVE